MSLEFLAGFVISFTWDLWREKRNANLLRDTIADFHAPTEEEWSEKIESMSTEELDEFVDLTWTDDMIQEYWRVKYHDFPPCKNCGNEGNVIFNYDLIYLCLDCEHLFDEHMDPEPWGGMDDYPTEV